MVEQPPWEAVGISRATWYRQGKPTEKPKKLLDAAQRLKLFTGRSTSVRTAQRIERVMNLDATLAHWILKGWCTAGEAEAVAKDPAKLRRFRKRLKEDQANRD